ncbi:hypothetical protein [Scleromatobacter humisilvae]|uniref:Uncharacterized protein n=1 Tax=Scleromatobacter humisilvae TaxID=2897159 RepID=A0A9X1YJC7_9BURK|nr:hypothetical protein [Scleromatobacter humisilvae]MCK9685462.1 hypothetical protein [Scleromatobacter humisilvae]
MSHFRLPHILLRLLAATLALFALADVRAQGCTAAVYEVIGEHLHVAGLASGELVDDAACKRDPVQPHVTLVALAWNDGRESEYLKGYVVAEVDEDAGKVLALMTGTAVADASTPLVGGDLAIDTAPYVLAPGVRAFGVDMSERVSHAADGGTDLRRTLYVREGRRLRPVLKGQSMSGHWIIDLGQGLETRVHESFQVSLAIGPHVSHGRHDLLMTTRFERSDGKPSTRETEHITDVYDGKSYRAIETAAPWELEDRKNAGR